MVFKLRPHDKRTSHLHYGLEAVTGCHVQRRKALARGGAERDYKQFILIRAQNQMQDNDNQNRNGNRQAETFARQCERVQRALARVIDRQALTFPSIGHATTDNG